MIKNIRCFLCDSELSKWSVKSHVINYVCYDCGYPTRITIQDNYLIYFDVALITDNKLYALSWSRANGELALFGAKNSDHNKNNELFSIENFNPTINLTLPLKEQFEKILTQMLNLSVFA
jgi:hypothetical protein